MLTFQEVCDRLRLSPKTLRKIIQSGDLHASRVGGNSAYRIAETDLSTYLARNALQVPA
jgi:excisionase family DNA binding protein